MREWLKVLRKMREAILLRVTDLYYMSDKSRSLLGCDKNAWKGSLGDGRVGSTRNLCSYLGNRFTGRICLT